MRHWSLYWSCATVVLALSNGAAVVQAEGQAMRTATFAIIVEETSGAQASTQWLSTGIAFDLEKRLGRLPGLEPADRLQTLAAMRGAPSGGVVAKVASVMERLKTAFVLHVSATLTESKLDVTVRAFTGNNIEAASVECRGSMDHLFALTDDLTGRVMSALRDAGIDPGTPHSPSALHKAPAKSVNVYRQVIRGMLALQAGRSAEARPELVSALEVEPDNWWGHYFLGAVEFHEGRLNEAANECRKAISVDPELYAGVYANLAYCYQGLGQRELAESARREFEQRSGKQLPARSMPGGPFSAGRPGVRQ